MVAVGRGFLFSLNLPMLEIHSVWQQERDGLDFICITHVNEENCDRC